MLSGCTNYTVFKIFRFNLAKGNGNLVNKLLKPMNYKMWILIFSFTSLSHLFCCLLYWPSGFPKLTFRVPKTDLQCSQNWPSGVPKTDLQGSQNWPSGVLKLTISGPKTDIQGSQNWHSGFPKLTFRDPKTYVYS